MAGVTLSGDEIGAAPSDVRRWLEQQFVRILGPQPALDLCSARPIAGADASHLAEPHVKSGEPNKEAAIHRRIAERAYEIWESQGRPHGCDRLHWRQAEQEIIRCDRNGSSEL